MDTKQASRTTLSDAARVAFRNRHQWSMDSRWEDSLGRKHVRYVRKAACALKWCMNDDATFQVWAPTPGVFDAATDLFELTIPQAVS